LAETIGGVTTNYGYTYDVSGRLTLVTKNSVTDETFTYDNNNNITASTSGASSYTGTYDNQDRVLTFKGYTFGHNINGEITSKQNASTLVTTTYAYNSLGYMTDVTLPSTDVISYSYDGQGRRVGREFNGTATNYFIYNGQYQIVGELNSLGGVETKYIYVSQGNSPDYMVRSGVTYKFIKNHLGSIRLVVNTSTGATVQRIDYDTYGKVVADTNPGLQPFGFAGGLYDYQTGLVRFGARDYDAETGRWTSKDPILFGGRQTNLYGYSFMDPINFIDPSGLDACGMNQGSGTVVCIDNNGNLSAVDRGSYSGNGAGKNNPASQNMADTGPIPTGSYIIGPSGPGGHMGPDTRHLTPTPGTRASFPPNRNADTFNWHGDSRSNPGGASQGCPISGPSTRNAPYTGSPFDVNNISF